MKLIYLETVLSFFKFWFMICLVSLSSAQSWVNYSALLRQDFPKYFCCELWGIPVSLVGAGIIPTTVWASWVPLIVLDSSFPRLGPFLTRRCWADFTNAQEGHTLSHRCSLFSGTLFLNSVSVAPDSQLHVLKSERLLVLFGFSVLRAEKLQVASQGNNRFISNFFFSLRNPWISLSAVQYVEIHCFIYFNWFFTVPCGRVNMGLIIPSQNLVLFCSEFLTLLTS